MEVPGLRETSGLTAHTRSFLQANRFRRPANFEASVQGHQQALAAFFAAVPTQGKPNFPATWKDFKNALVIAQNYKCGYCEINIAGQFGDVEHFFPKGEVWELIVGEEGVEQHGSIAVKGRRHTTFCDQGYWWLAYEWENYLLSCQICNQSWKLSFFPVAKPRSKPPHVAAVEKTLLLNPFDQDPARDPALHLSFDRLGQIRAKNRSELGFETIPTCGLDRESLRFAREQSANKA